MLGGCCAHHLAVSPHQHGVVGVAAGGDMKSSWCCSGEERDTMSPKNPAWSSPRPPSLRSAPSSATPTPRWGRTGVSGIGEQGGMGGCHVCHSPHPYGCLIPCSPATAPAGPISLGGYQPIQAGARCSPHTSGVKSEPTSRTPNSHPSLMGDEDGGERAAVHAPGGWKANVQGNEQSQKDASVRAGLGGGEDSGAQSNN